MAYTQRENRELASLIRSEIIESQFGVVSDYGACIALDYVAEVSENLLPPGEPNELFFRLLLAVLSHLRRDPAGAVWPAVNYFSLWAVRLSGFLGELRVSAESRRLAEEMMQTPIGQLQAREWTAKTGADLRRVLIRSDAGPHRTATPECPPPRKLSVDMDLFQETIFKLRNSGRIAARVIQEPYDMEVGAGTMAPETFLRVLGPEPWRVAYVQPSRRPADGRYGENPNRLYKHQQLQVILKPSPDDVLDLYLQSLQAIGIDLRKHDIKFEEDNWESPTLGAWGIGWQVMLDGLEITQFTYFQQCGGVDLDLVPAEITYGLERLVGFLQGAESIYDIQWAPGTGYEKVRLADELQNSVYNFELADVPTLWKLFDTYEGEAQRLLDLFAEVRGQETVPAARRVRLRSEMLEHV